VSTIKLSAGKASRLRKLDQETHKISLDSQKFGAKGTLSLQEHPSSRLLSGMQPEVAVFVVAHIVLKDNQISAAE